MKPAILLVRSPGFFAAVQDLGRAGWRRQGVPRAGVLDPALLRIANRLAGEDEAAPAIEFFAAGPVLEAVEGPVRLAWAGDLDAEWHRAGGASRRLEGWRSLTLQPGDVLSLGAPRRSRCGVVAVAGLRIDRVLGSAATYAPAGLGGIAGRALQAGDRLPLHGPAAASAASSAGPNGWRGLERRVRPPHPTGAQPPAGPEAPIAAVPGPQDDHFMPAALQAFFGSEYTVTAESDRMGLRLAGPALAHLAPDRAEIVSDATVPGSVQVPGNGAPIVLLADGQTAGGYPKIATIASADLPRLAIAPPGTRVRFSAVDVATAEDRARAHEAALQRLFAAIEPVPASEDLDLQALQAGNLISGMIDMRHPD